MVINLPPDFDIIMELASVRNKIETMEQHLYDISVAYEQAGRYTDIDHARIWQQDIVSTKEHLNLLKEHHQILLYLATEGNSALDLHIV